MNANIMLSLLKQFGKTKSYQLSVSGLFRIFKYCELCQIRAKYITFGDDQIDIYIEISKTDYFRKVKKCFDSST